MADDATQRMNYFDHQFLRVDDFSQEQSYHLDRRRRHNRLLHVWGIAEGLTVTAPNGATGVTVQPGTAIDGAGQEIVLTTVSSAVDLSGHAGKVVYVTIAYGEELSDPTSDAGVQGNRRWTETPKVEISENPPAHRDQQLILGRVTLDNTSKSTGKIDTGDGQNQRRLAGVVAGDLQANSLTLLNPAVAAGSAPRFHSDDNGNVHLSTAFGPLTIQGDLAVTDNLSVNQKVGIGTMDSPKAKLEVAGDLLVSGDSNVTMGRALLLMGRTDGSQGKEGEVTASIAFVSGIGGLNAQFSFRPGEGFELAYNDVPNLTYDRNKAIFADLTLGYLTANGSGTFGDGLAVKGTTTLDGLTGNEAATFSKDLTVKGNTTLAGLTGNEPATFAKDLTVTGKIFLGTGAAGSPFPLDVAGGGRMRVRSGTNGSAGIFLNQKGTTDAQPAADRAFVGMSDYNTIGFWSAASGIGWGLLMDITTARVRIGADPVDTGQKTTWQSAKNGSLFVLGDAYKGTVGTGWGIPSDLGLKKNVKSVDGALETLTRLRGVTFEWRTPESHGDQSGRYLGLIAQEVEEVMPDWVTSSSGGTKILNMIGFEALTIEACKELKSQLDAEKARNEALEARIRNLETQARAR